MFLGDSRKVNGLVGKSPKKTLSLEVYVQIWGKRAEIANRALMFHDQKIWLNKIFSHHMLLYHLFST